MKSYFLFVAFGLAIQPTMIRQNIRTLVFLHILRRCCVQLTPGRLRKKLYTFQSLKLNVLVRVWMASELPCQTRAAAKLCCCTQKSGMALRGAFQQATRVGKISVRIWQEPSLPV